MPDAASRCGDPLWQRLRPQPRILDRARADERLADLRRHDDPDLAAHLDRPQVRDMAAGIADHSPYLWHLIAIDPARFRGLLDNDPAASLDAILAGLAGLDLRDEAEVMRRLRHAKQALALLVGLADLGGVWSLDEVMRALSRGAEAFLGVALVHLLRKAAAAGQLLLPVPDDPQRGSGIAVLALGKLGGRELNYSSDVDLVIVFDPQSPALVAPQDCKTLFVRMVRDLVRLLQQATGEGYVLRVDLRLRPDPGATAVAIGLEAAFLYYESFGQNWERAAMIKARPVAGDPHVGAIFLKGLAPFIWRKYFDYAALSDIHAMKRQIHAAKGHGEIVVAGHDVKLGRGGIREIEFFVQTQQLIFGGKRPGLRGLSTVPMLRELGREGWITEEAVADLAGAYAFLRDVEHRLQMVADEQTHRLPRTPEGLERFAAFCSFASAAHFAEIFLRHLRAVARHYGRLFEQAPGLDEPGGSLVFTGVEDDPDTLETLANLGYVAPPRVAGLIREWHSGRRSAVRSPRAREALTDLVPKLLLTFSRTSDPDAALAAFDRTLSHMSAAGELFAILNANAALRALFGDILGSAPRLAAEIGVRPHLLDGAIDAARAICLDERLMTERAARIVAHATTTEDFLDAIRDFHHEEHFLIGVALLAGELPPEDAGDAYGALAVAVVRVVLARLREAFAREHGEVAGSAVAVVAMGKLGSREMTATSDLDLVVLYTYDDAHPDSDGGRSLPAQHYFGRLTTRFVTHLTAATRRGKLYDVDMRLRPSGRQGPIATRLSAFVPYQRVEAATWERMALTRARLVAGDDGFGAEVEAEIAAILQLPPKPTLRADIADMRALLDREKGTTGKWDLKLMRGGLIDIEFIAQFLVLQNASASPSLLDPRTRFVLREAAVLGLVDGDDAMRLIDAQRLFSATTQIVRSTLDPTDDPDRAGEAVKARIAAAIGAPDFAFLSAEIDRSRQAVRDIFRSVLMDR